MADTYTTDRRYLAAYLLSRGISLNRWHLKDGFVEFEFNDLGGTEDIVKEFHNNEAVMKPQDFIRSLETIQSIIREAKEGVR